MFIGDKLGMYNAYALAWGVFKENKYRVIVNVTYLLKKSKVLRHLSPQKMGIFKKSLQIVIFVDWSPKSLWHTLKLRFANNNIISAFYNKNLNFPLYSSLMFVISTSPTNRPIASFSLSSHHHHYHYHHRLHHILSSPPHLLNSSPSFPTSSSPHPPIASSPLTRAYSPPAPWASSWPSRPQWPSGSVVIWSGLGFVSKGEAAVLVSNKWPRLGLRVMEKIGLV